MLDGGKKVEVALIGARSVIEIREGFPLGLTCAISGVSLKENRTEAFSISRYGRRTILTHSHRPHHELIRSERNQQRNTEFLPFSRLLDTNLDSLLPYQSLETDFVSIGLRNLALEKDSIQSRSLEAHFLPFYFTYNTRFVKIVQHILELFPKTPVSPPTQEDHSSTLTTQPPMLFQVSMPEVRIDIPGKPTEFDLRFALSVKSELTQSNDKATFLSHHLELHSLEVTAQGDLSKHKRLISLKHSHLPAFSLRIGRDLNPKVESTPPKGPTLIEASLTAAELHLSQSAIISLLECLGFDLSAFSRPHTDPPFDISLKNSQFIAKEKEADRGVFTSLLVSLEDIEVVSGSETIMSSEMTAEKHTLHLSYIYAKISDFCSF